MKILCALDCCLDKRSNLTQLWWTWKRFDILETNEFILISIADLTVGQSTVTYWPQQDVSRVHWKGVTEEAGLTSPKQGTLTGLNSSLSDPFGITTSVKWTTSLTGLINCFLLSRNQPPCCKQIRSSFKGFAFGTVSCRSEVISGFTEDKGQGRDTVWSVVFWKPAFSPISSTLYFLLFVVRLHGTMQVPSTEPTMLGRR